MSRSERSADARERRGGAALAAGLRDDGFLHGGATRIAPSTVELRALLDTAAVEVVAERAAALVLERLGPVNESPLMTVPEAAA